MGPITFELTYDEYSEMYRVLGRIGPDWMRPMRYGGYAIMALGLGLLMERTAGWGWIVPAAIVLAGLCQIVAPAWIAYSALERNWEKYAAVPHAATVEKSGDGLRVVSPDWQVEYRPLAFERFVETRSLFLLVGRAAFRALAIPKRAIAERGELEEWRKLLAGMFDD